MKDRKRAMRRHHIARLKSAVRRYWPQDLPADPRRLGKAVQTRCACSCWMCGNPRRRLGERTVQERVGIEAFAAYLAA